MDNTQELELKKIKALDRHELEKILTDLGLPTTNHQTTKDFQEILERLVTRANVKVSDIIYKAL